MKDISRGLLGTAILLMAVSFHLVAATQRVYTYVGDAPTVHYNTYATGTFDLAIRLHNPALAGQKVTRIRARLNSMTQQVENCSLWLSSELKLEKIDGKKLNAPDICVIPAEPDAEGWMEVTLEEPYTLTENGVFAGYSFTSGTYDEDNRGPIMYSQSRHDGGFWFYSRLLAVRWMDYESTLKGVLPIYVTLEGETGEYELTPAEWDTAYPYAQTGSDFTLPLKLYNTGEKSATQFDISYSAGPDYSGTVQVNLPASLPCSLTDLQTIDVSLPASALSGKHDLTLSIDKADGQENAATRKATVLPLEFRPFVPVRRTLLEEATGTWCSACPRGWMAIEALNKLYPGRFLALAYHGGRDPMMSAAVSVPFEYSSYPSAVLDRGDLIDPYYGADKSQTDHFAIQRLVDAALRKPAEAGISVSASWADETRSHVSATASVQFVEGVDADGCKVAFILSADGLKGDGRYWSQVNSMNGRDPESVGPVLAPLTSMGNPIENMVYDHVALAGGPDAEAELSSAVGPQELTYTFNTAEAVSAFESTQGESLVQDTDMLRVVAVLLAKDGRVINVAQTHVSGASGVSDIANEATVISTDWYDVFGRRIAIPVTGLVIRLDRMSDDSVRVSKVIL